MVLKTAKNISARHSFIPSFWYIPFDSSSPSSTLHFLIHLLFLDTRRNNIQIEFVQVHTGRMHVLRWTAVCMQKQGKEWKWILLQNVPQHKWSIHPAAKCASFPSRILFVYRSSTPTRSCSTSFRFRPLFRFPACFYPSRCGCPRRKWSLSITIKDERK